MKSVRTVCTPLSLKTSQMIHQFVFFSLYSMQSVVCPVELKQVHWLWTSTIRPLRCLCAFSTQITRVQAGIL